MMSNTAGNNQPQRRSSRRQSQQKEKANTTSTAAAEEAAASDVTVPPQEQKKEKNKKSAYRDGNHPDTGLRARDCSCPKTQRSSCRARAWKYAAMNNKAMLCYLTIPPYPAAGSTTAAGRHTIKFRNCIARHLLGRLCTDGLPNEWTTGKDEISIQHFPPTFRDALLNMPTTKVDKWRISLDVGKAAGLTDVDFCEGKTHYLAAPSLREEHMKAELEEAERVYAVKSGDGMTAAAAIATGSFGNVTASMLKTPKPKKATTTQSVTEGAQPTAAVSATPVTRHRPRMSVEAKEHADLMKEVEKDPHKFVQQFIDMQLQVKKLKSLADNLMQEKKKDKEEYDKKVEQLRQDFESMVKTNGLNRKSILNNEYHKTYYWMSHFLFGRDWEEHKNFIEAAFHQHDVDVNVTGAEKYITNFEAINICCMLVRRGYCRGTIAGMYERTSLSTISNITTKWMPILGQVGASMSHLSLELNHSFYTEEQCKEYGLLYMKPDGNVIDYRRKD
jgi:hypothetical protein